VVILAAGARSSGGGGAILSRNEEIAFWVFLGLVSLAVLGMTGLLVKDVWCDWRQGR
jgi:hypothetical protein